VFAESRHRQADSRVVPQCQNKSSFNFKTCQRRKDVPFGYALQDDGTHLDTDADEQEAIEIIAELRRRGHILRRICSELEKRGVKTKNGKAKWHPQVVSRIVKRAA